MKVLLLSLNTLQVPYPVYPLGLDYVAGAIAAQHEVQRYDLNSGNLEELATVLASWQPEVIGLACRNIDNTEAGAPDYFLDQLSQLVSWLRSRSQAILVCGGSGFTIMPEAILALLRVDYGIVGEGERFPLLLTALEQGGDPALIPGVLAPGAPSRLAPPWDGERRRVLAAPEQRAFYVQQGGMLNLQSKRGCSFRCIYCPYPHIEGRSHRLVSPEEVAATALALQQAGARYLFFTDSAFNSDLRHSIKVARALRASRLALPWGAFFAPLRLARSDAGYFKLMAEAGCCHVEFGTESLSPSMLRNYRKPFTSDDVFAAHTAAKAAGLHVAHYFLLGGPGESATTVQQSLERIEQLPRAAFFFFIGIRIYPGTELYEIAVQEGQISQDTDLLQPVFYRANAIDRDQIEAMVLQQAAGRINWLVGSGGKTAANLVQKMHARGRVGPLWEHLAR